MSSPTATLQTMTNGRSDPSDRRELMRSSSTPSIACSSLGVNVSTAVSRRPCVVIQSTPRGRRRASVAARPSSTSIRPDVIEAQNLELRQEDPMSFTSRDGTRGARQPNGPLIRWFNARLIRRLRRRGRRLPRHADSWFSGRSAGGPGTSGSCPLAWFPADGEGWIIVASANGAPRNPAWYRNIVAHPDASSCSSDGETTPVEPEELHGEARAAAWQRVIAIVPRFRQYAAATDRELPVIRADAEAGRRLTLLSVGRELRRDPVPPTTSQV